MRASDDTRRLTTVNTLSPIPLVEIRCWRRARYAVDQEMPCSVFQILLIFVNLLGCSGA